MLGRILAAITSAAATAYFAYAVLTMKHGKECSILCWDGVDGNGKGAGGCDYVHPSCTGNPVLWWLLLILSIYLTSYGAWKVFEKWKAK